MKDAAKRERLPKDTMIELKPFDEIAGSNLGWLKARHHFAIGRYGNPAHKAIGNLYVLNDDEVAPGKGFGAHRHADVEIVTYVRTGSVAHRDSIGNEGRIEAGDVQVMSAGTGIEHAEHNPGDTPLKMFQLGLGPCHRRAATVGHKDLSESGSGWRARDARKWARH